MGTLGLPNKVEASDTINVYLFRGATCEHCHDALEYINEHREEIPDNVEIITYEVWRNSDNSTFHNEVAKALGLDEDDYNTVPLFVVGDEYILGYGTGTWEELFEFAENYASSDDYEDIVANTRNNTTLNLELEAMTLDDLYSEPNPIVTIIVYVVFGVIVLGFIGMIVFSRKK